MPYPSIAIANGFLERAFASDGRCTAMQLQKLCYLSHGFTLAIFDHALTTDKPEAWDFGPVYPKLYDAIKGYGSGPIDRLICRNNWASDLSIRGNVVRASLDEGELQVVDEVWENYGTLHAFQLSALTHEDDSPWATFYKPGQKHILIPDNAIKEYFVGLLNSDGDATESAAAAATALTSVKFAPDLHWSPARAAGKTPRSKRYCRNQGA